MSSDPVPPDPSRSASVYVLPSREPKLWVLLAVAAVWIFFVNVGFDLWRYLDQPGKDPQVELSECGLVGLLVSTVIYAAYFKRTWRLSLVILLNAALLGFLTGVSAIALHLIRHGWV